MKHSGINIGSFKNNKEVILSKQPLLKNVKYRLQIIFFDLI